MTDEATMEAQAPVPTLLREDLGPREHLRASAPARLLSSPDARRGLGGVLVLTSDRLVLVPGARGSPGARTPRPGEHVGRMLAEAVDAFGSGLLQALLGPGARGNAAVALAGRSRPGVEVPLSLVRRFFVARVPHCIGLELTLPPRDGRPPFALFFDLLERERARRWAEAIERARADAPPRPDLERPYALFYLLRDPPVPVVRTHVLGHRRRGALRLGADGPEVGGNRRELLLPYESIERVQWAPPTPTRRAALALTAGEREWVLEPVRRRDVAALHDVGHLLGELAGRAVEPTVGHLRGGRLATWTAAAGGAAAALYELLGG